MGFGSIQIGMSGMLAFSRALDVISNNVANLNTPGFKLSELEFADLFYDQMTAGRNGESEFSLALGSGVSTPSTSIRFSQGEFRETGNAPDVAIDGNGFFVLRNSEGETYTRAGQFEFSKDGYLVSSTGGSRVAALDEKGDLVDFSIGALLISPPRATETIKLVDNLSSGSTTHTVTGVKVHDSLGELHELTIFVSKSDSGEPRAWLIQVRDADGNEIADAGEVRFSGDGSPLAGWNEAKFVFEPDDAPASEVTIHLGEPGRFDGATCFSAGSISTLRFGSQDGFGPGSAVGFAFDERGFLQVEYSNGQTHTGPQLALAWLDDLQSLQQLGAGVFRASEGSEVRIGVAGEGVMGSIRGGTVEISNVDLTEQFTNLIIVQRGFQASSQVLMAANEMIQQLLEGTRSGR